MKITRKRGLKEVKIEHNRALFWIIIVLLIALGIVVCMIIRKPWLDNSIKVGECGSDNDCVLASCCHAVNCVASANAPVCDGIMCSQECQPETLDCLQGSCKCIDNKCEAVLA